MNRDSGYPINPTCRHGAAQSQQASVNFISCSTPDLVTPTSNKQFTRTQTLDNLPVQIEVKDTMATTQCPMRQTVQENVRALAHHQTSSSPEVRQGHSSSKDKAIVFGAADLITAVETIRIPLNISVSLFSLQLPSAHGTRILFPLLNSSP